MRDCPLPNPASGRHVKGLYHKFGEFFPETSSPGTGARSMCSKKVPMISGFPTFQRLIFPVFSSMFQLCQWQKGNSHGPNNLDSGDSAGEIGFE